jgi:hypothetical protein
MFGLIKLLHFHLGWGAQGDLCRVGEEFIDEIHENDEGAVARNDTGAILKHYSHMLISKYNVASAIAIEVADDMSVAKAAIMPPYRLSINNCVFQELHQLFLKYKIRRSWRRIPAGRDGMFLICPLMNLLVHALEINSEYLAGHCLEATKLEGNTCICLIDVFSRKLDVVNFPEETNPEVYRLSESNP